jgi:GT2 family glycosyltransferase
MPPEFMPRTAVIILNRNLPEPTDALAQRFKDLEGNQADVFVVEAGSDPELLSQGCTWHARTPEVTEMGLRTARGFNYGLARLYEEERFEDYGFFFLMTNDSVFEPRPVVATLVSEMQKHPRLGVLSPCARNWGEYRLLERTPTRYFWHVQNTANFLRRSFVESVMNPEDELRFLYDGENFRGYLAESELIAKGYANDWATGITRLVMVEEDERYLKELSATIRTESFEENLRLYLQEGKAWMRKKYGFTSRWQMQMYVRLWYDKFFDFHPEYTQYRI